jgi:GrpB-like predicted nucleotidyltransferase (UPF0157 family)
MSRDTRRAERQLDEPVALRPYDPSWPERFERERRRIDASLGADAAAIEHIGSTAVPGLSAKPIVDVLVGVDGPLAGHRVIARLVALGYEFLGEAGVPGRLYFRRRRAGGAFNVHVVAHESELWRDNLALRDFLRAHPDAAAVYAQAKARAAAAAPDSLLRYSDLKAGAVAQLLAQARAQRGSGDGTP